MWGRRARDSAVTRAVLAGEKAAEEGGPGGSTSTSGTARALERALARAAEGAGEGSASATATALPVTPDVPSSRERKEAAEEAEGRRTFWPRPQHFLCSVLASILGVAGFIQWTDHLIEYGAAFTVASSVLLLTVHLPLAVLEIGLGQFSSSGPLHVFRHVLPALEAVGWAQLLLGFYFGVANGVHSARILAYLVAAFSATDGVHCLDPQREPASPFSAFCTNGPAHMACGALARRSEVGEDSGALWLVAGRCVDGPGLAASYLPRLEECWANASHRRPVDPILCALTVHLYFNRTSPINFFRPRAAFRNHLITAIRHPESEGARDVGCLKTLFQEKNRCKAGLLPADRLDWARVAEDREASTLSLRDQREMVIDLRGWEARPEETRARAACLHRLIAGARVDKSTCQPPMAKAPRRSWTPTSRPRAFRRRRDTRGKSSRAVSACLIRSYCALTFPSETGLGELGCFRRVLNPVPSFLTVEREKPVFGAHAADAPQSPRLVAFMVLGWPVVLLFVWGGVRRMGQLSFYTGALPLAVILGQTCMIFIQQDLVPGVRWSLRLDGCRFLEAQLWVKASSCNFFGLSLGKGILMSLASYNRFHQDGLRDALVAGGASLLFYPLLGALSTGYATSLASRLSLSPERLFAAGQDTDRLSTQGAEEEGFLSLAGPLTMLLFVLTTTSSAILALVTAASDEWEWLRGHWGKMVLLASVALTLPGLAFYSGSDSRLRLERHVFLVEAVLTPGSQLVLVLFLAYVYGARRLLEDFDLMLDGRSEYRADSHFGAGRALVRGRGRLWLLGTWGLVAPLGLAVLTGLAVGEAWEAGLGLLGALAALFVPALLYSLLGRRISPANLFRARLDWGPELEEHKTGRYASQALRTEALFGRGHREAFFRASKDLHGPAPARDTRLNPARPHTKAR